MGRGGEEPGGLRLQPQPLCSSLRGRRHHHVLRAAAAALAEGGGGAGAGLSAAGGAGGGPGPGSRGRAPGGGRCGPGTPPTAQLGPAAAAPGPRLGGRCGQEPLPARPRCVCAVP